MVTNLLIEQKGYILKMTRIRIEGDTEQEVHRAIDLFTTVYDCIDFTPPMKGNNPKYSQRQKYFSYGILQEPNQPQQ